MTDPLYNNQRWVERFLIKAKQKRKQEMSNFITGLIRTYVPIIVGAIVAWATSVGLELDGETQAGLIVGLTGLLQAGYYLLIRWLETKYPRIGVLLGKATQPEYK